MDDINIPGYVIKRKLGSGGMADVFLATQKSFGRDVAIKILSPDTAANQDFTARFVREAKIVAGLSHPHIIPVYQVGKSDKHYFMSMDYLPGGDLEQWIKSGIPENEILNIIQQIAGALYYAHQKGYMHRDIKPANIMFREDNSAVLTDFGIARLQSADDQLTQVGMIVGTPKYMSPEAVRGKELDGRADIYALGIVFYEILMKDVPYRANDFTALAVKHAQDPVPELPKAYSKYQAFLNKLMAKNVDERYQSGKEVVKAIKELQSDLQRPKTAQVPSGTKEAGNKKPILAETSVNTDSSSENNVLKTKKDSIPDGLSFAENAVRKGLFKKHEVICNFRASDSHSLSVYFNNASDQLIKWYKQYKDKIDTIEYNLVTEPWCFDIADKAILNLYHAGGVFDFLKKVPIKVSMVAYDGSESISYTINTKGEKVLAA